MVDVTANSYTVEQRALLALWSVPGLGPRTLERVRSFAGGALARLAACPVKDWLAESPLPPLVRRRLAEVPELGPLATRLLERCGWPSRVSPPTPRAWPKRRMPPRCCSTGGRWDRPGVAPRWWVADIRIRDFFLSPGRSPGA